MKIAVLWTHLSGYLNCSMQALASRPGVELYVVNQAAGRVAPYASSAFEWIPRRYEYADVPDRRRLFREMEAFDPDVILASWHVKAYQGCCIRLKQRTVGVACADNQWSGNLRQRIASMTSSLHLKKYYDAIFIPGERQATWARRMGFDESRIWEGLYAAEVDSFSAAGLKRNYEKPAFLFTARLAAEKGIATLAEAYEGYAKEISAAGEEPWSFLVAGTGPLDHLLTHPGFIKLGFVQPEALPELFGRAACFVMPSLFEPWGVALEEAAASGLPIVCTRECGASVHTVQDNYNGFVVKAKDPGQLQAAMTKMTRLTMERRQQMSEASRMLGMQFKPERWATTVLEKGRELHDLLKV